MGKQKIYQEITNKLVETKVDGGISQKIIAKSKYNVDCTVIDFKNNIPTYTHRVHYAWMLIEKYTESVHSIAHMSTAKMYVAFANYNLIPHLIFGRKLTCIDYRK